MPPEGMGLPAPPLTVTIMTSGSIVVGFCVTGVSVTVGVMIGEL